MKFRDGIKKARFWIRNNSYLKTRIACCGFKGGGGAIS